MPLSRSLVATLRVALVLAGAGLSATSGRAQADPSPIRWEPYETAGADGQPLRGDLGRLTLPERRGAPGAATIELAFVRFRSADPRPLSTIFFLVGGPGPSGIEHCVGPATGRFVRLLEHHDVVGVDYRGTGRSRPDLSDAPPFALELPLDRAVTADEVGAAWRVALERAVAHWRGAGVDPGAYTTAQIADDLDDLRAALGLPRVVLWGQSYGTHLGLAYLRRHGEHVERAVLFRVEGPDDTFKRPAAAQQGLERLAALVAADATLARALPDPLGTVRGLLARLAGQPAVVDLGQEGLPPSVTAGPFDLQRWLADSLGSLPALARLPADLLAMQQGDFSALAETAWFNRRDEVGSLMPWLVDCASGASAERRAGIARQAADPAHVLGDAANAPYPGVCAACPGLDLGEAFRGPLESDVPVLFASGELDTRTPPENVEALLPGFPRGVHLRVANAAHEPMEVMLPEFQEILRAFLRGEDVSSAELTLPPPRWAPIAGG